MDTDTPQILEIKKALDEIRPLLAWHKGGIDFVKFEEGVVYVKMTGMCDGCPLAGLTLKSGVEELLKTRVKEVKEVRAV